MNKLFLFLAVAFAVTLSIFACSGNSGGGSPSEDYGCYTENSSGARCDAIGQNRSQDQCREINGEVMDLSDCEAKYNTWKDNNGSCAAGRLCYDISKIECSTLAGSSFNPGGKCPYSAKGACTFTYNNKETCVENFSQNNCDVMEGAFVLNGQCPGSDIFGACTIDLCYNNISQYTCSTHQGSSFAANEDCPGTDVEGSCIIDGECENITQFECSHARGSFFEEKCPGSDINGYCMIEGECARTTQHDCLNYFHGTFDENMCPGSGSCTYSNSLCWENETSASCANNGNGYVFALNSLCSTALFPYCIDTEINRCDKIGGENVSNSAECLANKYGYLANLAFCQNQRATIVD